MVAVMRILQHCGLQTRAPLNLLGTLLSACSRQKYIVLRHPAVLLWTQVPPIASLNPCYAIHLLATRLLPEVLLVQANGRRDL